MTSDLLVVLVMATVSLGILHFIAHQRPDEGGPDPG